MRRFILAAIGGVLLLDVVLTSWYTVDETERAVVLQVSNPLYETVRAGGHLKAPWPFQSVKFVEKRLIKYDASPREVITKDKKTMVVDTFSYFQIEDGIRFLQKIQTDAGALARVDDSIYSEMRNELSTKDFEEILTSQRVAIMDIVTQRADARLSEYGLRTSLVRMNKADLPPENKASVFERMRSERERQAKQYRSEGEEEYTKIVGATDKEVTTLIAAAFRTTQKNRGEGDAEATRIYSEAYSTDPKFFRIWRGLQAAEKAMTSGGNVRILQNGKEPHLEVLFGNR